ncbi:adenosine deaminase [Fluoribacter dumoffii]|uniref:adenosine deaminase family protein n=1 Tax=Fluoribacter dumoffii TaxID=463 RepID=UPI00224364C1|nr:adenosine deaminase [Fluoribacter dumoffii]MCW8386515.1 adenosine deaminase [Fluoribacter dumoffii]MCW8498211.1 adenosine deaminase [Fluoribacter dumoffii]
MNYIKPISFLACLFFSALVQANIQSYFDQIKNDPNALYAFLKSMPKGGELHYHLAGGAYPEIMLEVASKEDYCLNTNNWVVSKKSSECNGVETKDLLNHPELYANTVKSWSMKDFVPGKESGHDHFFNSFYKFNAIVADHQSELIASVMNTAAQQNEHYMELMVLPDNAHSTSFGDMLKGTTSFSQKRKILLKNQDFQNNINYTAIEANNLVQQARQKLGCETHPDQKACKIKINFIYYSLREQPLDNLFAQTLNAFEAVAQSMKSRGALVGVNLVQPEDGIISLRDYRKQMQMYQYLHKLYPQVNIALHAGEITQEIVTPEDLDYHIHDALFTGQAQRIGHGVDIAHENNVNKTLDYMASQHKAVEINLVSNQKILKVSGADHPLNFYLKHHVPVVLSTDDEGILRTNLTQQYVEAVLSHGLDYSTLKQINRNALTYSFLPGRSIWADAEKALLVSDCQNLQSESCLRFIKTNEKAQLQWNLEQQLRSFENRF